MPKISPDLICPKFQCTVAGCSHKIPHQKKELCDDTNTKCKVKCVPVSVQKGPDGVKIEFLISYDIPTIKL